MKETLLAYWRQLNEREQTLLSIAGILIGLLILYYGLYSPLYHARLAMQEQLLDARRTLVWMKQVEPILVKKEALETLNSAHLLTVLSTQLTQASELKQYPYHLEQAAANRIQLTFERVSYITFMTWLNQLSTRYAFSIQQLHVTRTNTSDHVKLLLVIEAS
jgi:general secretion pathway protein M